VGGSAVGGGRRGGGGERSGWGFGGDPGSGAESLLRREVWLYIVGTVGTEYQSAHVCIGGAWQGDDKTCMNVQNQHHSTHQQLAAA
jgi:hypothetical protein